MPIAPIITFKAGKCELEGKAVKPDPTPGYIYLYSEDDLVHFCWRPRGAPMDTPELDLLMLPTDGSFTPYEPMSAENPTPEKKPTNGRIYVLRFSSSSQRYLFWLQSGSQHPNKDPAWFSARDLKLGEIVNTLLLGEDVNVEEEMAAVPHDSDRRDGGDDDDEAMEDVEGTNHDHGFHRSGSGGAGPGATGGDIREEGEESREGGADGGRAAAAGDMDANAIIQNFINSMGGKQTGPGRQAAQGKLFTTLQDLLTPASTIAYLEQISEPEVDRLLQYLPPQLLTLAKTADGVSEDSDLNLTQKKSILARVLRSPQFTQSNSSLTIALRDGGLPSIADALGVQVQNGGFMRGGAVPLGGGEAVEAFLEGVKDQVKKERGEGGDSMDTQ